MVNDVVINALTLDLDDTLWPIAPIIERAEQAVHGYLLQHCPSTAERFPIARMRALREQVALDNPQLAHDFSAQRRLSLAAALREAGDDPEHLEPAFAAFFAARNTVDLYQDAVEALPKLAARWPLAALTNGNADLRWIGLHTHFRFTLAAREHGAAKPAASIFLAACQRLRQPPDCVLHVGDDPWLDVAGAAAVGMRTCWINRQQAEWPRELARPDLEIDDIRQLLALPTQAERQPDHSH